MGKKMKPKGKNPRKPQPRSRVSDPIPNSSDPKPNSSESGEETNETSNCKHYTKGDSHLNKILLSILSSSGELSSCDHCRDEPSHANNKKGGAKKKTNRKGGESKSNLEPIWVCLDCGRSFCGGAVNEAVPYGHSRRHAKQERHNWAIGTDSAGTAWCFLCDSEVPIEMPSIEETESKAAKSASSPEPDYRISKTESKSESKPEPAFQIRDHHIVRGLSNLGNTCFFNSVLQNLLALKPLRETLFPPQNPNPKPNSPTSTSTSTSRVSITGPLTMSLKKVFIETSLGDEFHKGTISPKNLFGNICVKAPQFRGFNQQDSHELLRCLLDGLHAEETSARKSKREGSDETDKSVSLVDSLFGGLLSSTVSCTVCGHTSLVHEPFLDLSLPVPAKKTNNNNGKKSGTSNNNIRPTILRGRGSRAQRIKGTRSSPVEEKLEASSSKEGEKAICTVSEADGSSKDETVSAGNAGTNGLESTDVKAGTGTNGLESTDVKAGTGMNGLESTDVKAGMGTNGPESTNFKAESAVLEAEEFSSSWMDYVDAEEPAKDSEMDSVKLEGAVSETDLVGLESMVSEARIDAELLGNADLKEKKVQDNHVSKEIYCTDFDALENHDILSENPNSTGLKAKEALVNSLNAVSDESDGTNLKAKVDEVPTTPIPNELESMISEENIAKLESTVIDDESWLMVDDWSGSKPESNPDPLSEINSIETLASDMGFSPLMVPSPNPNPNPISPPKEDETDFAAEPLSEINSIETLASDMSFSPLMGPSPNPNPNPISPPKEDETDFAAEPLSEINSIETLASDMGFSPLMGPSPNPNPNPNPISPPKEEDETDFAGFGGMFDLPDEEETSYGPVNKPSTKAEEEEDDSIFWGINMNSLNGFGSVLQEVDDTDNPVSITSCLSLFTKPEVLSGEHAWHCEKCSELQSGAIEEIAEEKKGKNKVMRDAVKRFLIDKGPQILTVHLKRFSQDHRGRLSKLRGHVNFEEILDIKPFFGPRRSKEEEEERYEYRLVGVVEHSGSMGGGHYVAYVRGERVMKGGAHCQSWFYASDAHVKEVSLQEVLRSEAYLLFYERIDN